MQRHARQGSNDLEYKNTDLRTSMMALVSISGHACTGTTISDKRYWPSGAKQLSSQAVVQHPENALGSAMAQFTGTVGRGYYGGPNPTIEVTFGILASTLSWHT
jgi:hypothetical protein